MLNFVKIAQNMLKGAAGIALPHGGDAYRFLVVLYNFVSGLHVCGLFFKTSQADNGKAVKTVCQRIFKKNCALKV